MEQTVRITPVTDQWLKKQARKFNRKKIEEYLQHSPRLSPATLQQYRSCLRIFAKWIYDYCDNKKIIELKIRDGKAYQDWLLSHNGSTNNIKVKLAAASELCEYIEKYYEDEFPSFRNPIRKGREAMVQTPRKDKRPITPVEFELLMSTLEKRQDYQRLCYLVLTYQTACRRAESAQFERRIAQYSVEDMLNYQDDQGSNHNYFLSNSIRCKGAGRLGKVRQFKISTETMHYVRRWDKQRRQLVDNLGVCDEATNLFVHIDKSGVNNLTAAAFAYWFSEDFSKILDRNVHPHDLRTTRATDLVVREHKPIEAVSVMMGHNSTATTKTFYVIDNRKDSDAALI